MSSDLRRYAPAWRVVAALLLALLALDGAAPSSTAVTPGSWPSDWRLGASGVAPPAVRGATGPESGRPVLAHEQPILPAPQPRQGLMAFLTVLCKFADVSDEPEPPAFFTRLLGDSYPGLGDYWRTVSYSAISLAGSSVVGWYGLPHGRAAYAAGPAAVRPPAATADLQRLAEDCTAAIDAPLEWTRYTGLNLVFNADVDLPHGGEVCLWRAGAERCYVATWMWAASLPDQATWAHEMGHAFGLKHSSLDLSGGYDNAWDVMSDSGICNPGAGYRHVAQEPIAFDKDLLGWIPDGRKFLAAPNNETTITLERLALPGPDGYLLAQIPIPNAGSPGGMPRHFYTVEARRFAGYDRNLPGEAVVIHEVDLSRATPARPVPFDAEDAGGGMDGAAATSAMWAPGSMFSDPEHGISVAVEQATPTGFVVSISRQPRPRPLTPADHALLPAGDVGFAWEQVPGAAGFELELRAATGQGAGVTVTQTAHSAGYTATLAPGRYKWRVRVRFAAGAGPWTAPRELLVSQLVPAPPAAPDPLPLRAASRVAMADDRHGGAYAVWAATSAAAAGFSSLGVPSGLQTDIYAAHRAAGGGWGPAVKINDDPGTAHQSPGVATDAAGNAYAIWNAAEADENGGIYAAYRPYEANNWSQSSRVNDDLGNRAVHTFAAQAVDQQGDTYVTWIDDRKGTTDVYFAHRGHSAAGTTGGWSVNTRVSDDTSVVLSTPSIVADAEGNAYLAWRRQRPCRGVDIAFAGRTAGGAWGPVVPVTANPAGRMLQDPHLALDGRNTIYAVWQEDRGTYGNVHAARCEPHCGLPGADATSWGSAAWLGRAAGLARLSGWRLQLVARGDLCLVWPLTEEGAGPPGCLALDALASRPN